MVIGNVGPGPDYGIGIVGSYLEQTTLQRLICQDYLNLLYQTEDSPISHHCIIDMCYPATDSLFCETSY